VLDREYEKDVVLPLNSLGQEQAQWHDAFGGLVVFFKFVSYFKNDGIKQNMYQIIQQSSRKIFDPLAQLYLCKR
jgi:hypothetical protein